MNKYNKLELIGNGSYGKVYKIRKIKNNNIYALKQIKIKKLKDTYEIKNLINELKILCFHDCEYLLRCREIFYDNRQINIVTDFAKFSDLNNYIKKYKNKNKLINENNIWLIFIKCCYGIQYLHEYNIIHRDLKPANILLHNNCSILIADFGISKIIEQKINSFTLIGTPYYISPEMYKDINYDKKIDIWAIGCILYELVTLNVPFQANDIYNLKKKIIGGFYYDNISNYYSKDIQSMIRFLLDINVDRRPNINEILSSRIFKKKEHELNLVNSNNFNSQINDKIHNYYSPPNITSNWNLIIDDIHNNNDNKSPIIFEHKSLLPKINNSEPEPEPEPVVDLNHNNYDSNLPKITNKSNLDLPKIKKPLPYKYNLPKINVKQNYSPSIYPDLPKVNSNYDYYKNKKYVSKYVNYSIYNANYYKNKYKSNYNIINNSRLY